MMTTGKRMLRRAGFAVLMLLFLAMGSFSALAAQARLNYSTNPSGAGKFRVYVNQRGKKTYLQDMGGYFMVSIPDGASLGTTVFFEIQPETCFAFAGFRSNDTKIERDQNGVQYYKFTKTKDAGQTRTVQAVFNNNHRMTVIPKVDATCQRTGNKQYYRCSICGQYYSNQQGTKVTTPKKMTIAKKAHKWDKGVVTKRATSTSTGTLTLTCQWCKTKKTQTIPKLYVDPISEKAISPDNPVSFDSIDKKARKMTYKKVLSGSTFGLLCARGTTPGKKLTKLSWKKVPTAKKYVVYQAKHNGKFKKVATLSKRVYYPKKLSKGKYYGYMVVAVNGSKAVAVSRPIYVAAGRNGKFINPAALDVSDDIVSIRVGATHQLTVSHVLPEGGFKWIKNIKYESSDMYVANVGTTGTIVGVGKGNCTVRVFDQNGLYKEVKVYVY